MTKQAQWWAQWWAQLAVCAEQEAGNETGQCSVGFFHFPLWIQSRSPGDSATHIQSEFSFLNQPSLETP